jgi:acetyl-CoA acetyltransferase
MREVAIVGVGLHPWGKFPDKTFVDMGVEAVVRALEDANMQWRDIQSVVSGIWIWGGNNGFNAGQSLAAVMGETGIPITNVFNMCATATSVLRTAYHVVASGEQDICLAVGLDKSPAGFLTAVGRPEPTDTDYLRWKMLGLTNPGYWAIECRKRMMKFGTTECHLAKAKVACSKHGALNPSALYRKVYTEDEVLKSPMVCDPLRLYMICATRDGAAAVILCSADKAKKFSVKPIKVAGVGLGSSLYGDPTIRLGLLSTITEGETPCLSESAMSARMAFEKAGIGPEDVDFVELPDNSSWHYLQYLETIGFCKEGEAERLLDEGETMIGGRLPVCPSGGASSFGEAVAAEGLLQVCELVCQLRGQAGARQVEGAKVGMAQTYGMLGNSAAAILKV